MTNREKFISVFGVDIIDFAWDAWDGIWEQPFHKRNWYRCTYERDGKTITRYEHDVSAKKAKEFMIARLRGNGEGIRTLKVYQNVTK
jgi:hypothetical protein